MKSTHDHESWNEFDQGKTQYIKYRVSNVFLISVKFWNEEIIIKIKENQYQAIGQEIPLERRNAEKIIL